MVYQHLDKQIAHVVCSKSTDKYLQSVFFALLFMLLLKNEFWPIFIEKWVQEWIKNDLYYTVLDFSKLPAELYHDA